MLFVLVPGPPSHLVFIQTNTSAGRVTWSAPSESNGKLRSYRIYFTPEEMASRQLDEWAQVSSNQTTVEITALVLASYSVTVKASTQVRNFTINSVNSSLVCHVCIFSSFIIVFQAGYGKAADIMKVVLTGNTVETNFTDTRPTSHYTLLLALLCGAVAVLITIGNFQFLLL